MVTYTKRQKLDGYIEIVNACYQNSYKLPSQVHDALCLLNAEEKNYLNDHLHLDKIVDINKDSVLHKLFQLNDKIDFAKGLLNTPTIDFSVNSIDENGKSLFQILLEQTDLLDFDFKNTLFTLYRRGYKSKASDATFLASFFHTMPQIPEFQDRWCTARTFHILDDAEKIKQTFSDSLSRVICTIASIKQGKPFGYRLNNLLAIVNNALQHHKEFGEIILQAMHHYNIYEEVLASDNKGSFRSKVALFKKTAPPQHNELLPIIWEIYPELKKVNSIV